MTLQTPADHFGFLAQSDRCPACRQNLALAFADSARKGLASLHLVERVRKFARSILNRQIFAQTKSGKDPP
jgi:hypothetical protein